MASIINVDTINEKTTGNGVQIPGHVVQVVQATTGTSASTTSTNFVATSLSANITLSNSSNKVVIMVSGRLNNSTSGGGVDLTVYRDSTNIGFQASRLANQYFNRSGGNSNQMALAYLDTPSTASQITYEVRIRSGGGGSTAAFEQSQAMILMEIAQ